MLYFELNTPSSKIPLKLKKMDIENQASQIIDCPRDYYLLCQNVVMLMITFILLIVFHLKFNIMSGTFLQIKRH